MAIHGVPLPMIMLLASRTITCPEKELPGSPNRMMPRQSYTVSALARSRRVRTVSFANAC